MRIAPDTLPLGWEQRQPDNGAVLHLTSVRSPITVFARIRSAGMNYAFGYIRMLLINGLC